MKKNINNNGMSLIEIIVGLFIITIIFVTVMANLNVFSNLILHSSKKNSNVNKLISAANEFDISNEVNMQENFGQIKFILDDEEIMIDIKYKDYFLKSEPKKKLVTFLKN